MYFFIFKSSKENKKQKKWKPPFKYLKNQTNYKEIKLSINNVVVDRDQDTLENKMKCSFCEVNYEFEVVLSFKVIENCHLTFFSMKVENTLKNPLS